MGRKRGGEERESKYMYIFFFNTDRERNGNLKIWRFGDLEITMMCTVIGTGYLVFGT